jgi:hypothetical protein
MVSQSNHPIRWNIFARELENILHAHDLRLGQLDDRGIVLHPQKVWRLQQSLLSPTHFPTLNPEELDRLVTYLDLSQAEQNRLHAAIVATGVERTLIDRIHPDVALMAANDVFELCLATMRAQPDLALTAGVKGGTTIYGPDAPQERELAELLDAIDEATSYRLAANSATLLKARLHATRQAQLAYTRARLLLGQIAAVSPDYTSTELWQWCSSEADYGYRITTTLLQTHEGGEA